MPDIQIVIGDLVAESDTVVQRSPSANTAVGSSVSTSPRSAAAPKPCAIFPSMRANA